MPIPPSNRSRCDQPWPATPPWWPVSGAGAVGQAILVCGFFAITGWARSLLDLDRRTRKGFCAKVRGLCLRGSWGMSSNGDKARRRLASVELQYRRFERRTKPSWPWFWPRSAPMLPFTSRQLLVHDIHPVRAWAGQGSPYQRRCIFATRQECCFMARLLGATAPFRASVCPQRGRR